MERELLFVDKLQELRETARVQGNIVTEDQIGEAFEELGLDEEQLSLVKEYLSKHHIGIGTAVPEEEYLSGEERNFLKMYEDDLKAIVPLTDGEKRALTMAAMAGEKDAQDRLLQDYLASVVDVARLYAGQGIPVEDLIGEGNVALAIGVTMLGAMEKVDEADGMLMKMVMDAMEQYIDENGSESKNDNKLADKVNKVADAAAALAQSYGRKVTVAELMEETGMSEKMIRDAIRLSGDKIEDLESGL